MAFNAFPQDAGVTEHYTLRFESSLGVAQYQSWPSAEWINLPTFGAQYLSSLLDVAIGGPPTTGDILQWNGTYWVNAAIAPVSPGTTAGATMVWDGVSWTESLELVNDGGTELVFFGVGGSPLWPAVPDRVLGFFRDLQSIYVGRDSGGTGKLGLPNLQGYCLSIGDDNLTAGTSNFLHGVGNTASGNYNFAWGSGNTFSGVTQFSAALGQNCAVTGSVGALATGVSNTISNSAGAAILGGSGNSITAAPNSAVIACTGVAATASDTVYVPSLAVTGQNFSFDLVSADRPAGSVGLTIVGPDSLAIVSNASVTGSSIILLTGQDDTVLGTCRISSITPGVGFTIKSSNNTDTGVVAYLIINAA